MIRASGYATKTTWTRWWARPHASVQNRQRVRVNSLKTSQLLTFSYLSLAKFDTHLVILLLVDCKTPWGMTMKKKALSSDCKRFRLMLTLELAVMLPAAVLLYINF